jgi:hypothetical protein
MISSPDDRDITTWHLLVIVRVHGACSVTSEILASSHPERLIAGTRQLMLNVVQTTVLTLFSNVLAVKLRGDLHLRTS